LRRLNEEWTRSECREATSPPEKKVLSLAHPKDSIEVRRALRGCEKIRSEIRATHDSITFIERAYRKKDPAYADFSIQQQEHLLQRLSEEWSASECGAPPPTPEKKNGAVD
jgi:hypothetical protein